MSLYVSRYGCGVIGYPEVACRTHDAGKTAGVKVLGFVPPAPPCSRKILPPKRNNPCSRNRLQLGHGECSIVSGHSIRNHTPAAYDKPLCSPAPSVRCQPFTVKRRLEFPARTKIDGKCRLYFSVTISRILQQYPQSRVQQTEARSLLKRSAAAGRPGVLGCVHHTSFKKSPTPPASFLKQPPKH